MKMMRPCVGCTDSDNKETPCAQVSACTDNPARVASCAFRAAWLGGDPCAACASRESECAENDGTARQSCAFRLSAPTATLQQ